MRRLALTVAILALLAGGTAAALGAGGGHTAKSAHARKAARPSLLSVAAGYLGSSPTLLRAQLQSGKSLAQIAEASPGHSANGLTAALQASRSTNLHERITALVDRAGATMRAAQKHAHPSLRAAATSYLGLTRSSLRSKLHSGRSLAEIATATTGRSAVGLIDAILAVRTRHEGLATHNQATHLKRIRERVKAAVERKHHRASSSH